MLMQCRRATSAVDRVREATLVPLVPEMKYEAPLEASSHLPVAVRFFLKNIAACFYFRPTTTTSARYLLDASGTIGILT